MEACSYGCGNNASFYNERNKRWCCSSRANSCPEVRRKNSERQKDPEHIAKKKERFKAKHGVEHQMHLVSTRDKRKNTSLDRYGTENPAQADAVKSKMIETNIERYGVQYSCLAESVINKKTKTWQDKYNGHPMHDAIVAEKQRSTLLERYGVDNAGKTEASKAQAAKPKTEESNYRRSQTWQDKTPPQIEAIMQKRQESSGFRTPFELAENRSSRSVSKQETIWLDSLNNPNLLRQHRLLELNIIVDGYDPTTNTVYLYHGDFWHGNPEVFEANAVNPRTKCTFGELYCRTKSYEECIISAGYNLMTMWENNYGKVSYKDSAITLGKFSLGDGENGTF